MKEKLKETPEQEARRLRDVVYGIPTTDKNWDYCKDNWVKSIDWLREHAKKVLTSTTPSV